MGHNGGPERHKRPRWDRQDVAAVCSAVIGELSLLAVACLHDDLFVVRSIAVICAVLALGNGIAFNVSRRRADFYRDLLMHLLRQRWTKRPRRPVTRTFSDN